MKRIKKILKAFSTIALGILILAIAISSINNRIGNCTIEGEVIGLGTGIALVSGGHYSHDKNYIKLIMVINDKFSFKVNSSDAGGGRIITWNMLFRRKSGEFLTTRSKIIAYNVLPDEQITINGSMKEHSVLYTVSGNAISEQSSEFLKENIAILEEETQLGLKIDSLEFYGDSSNQLDSLNKLFGKTKEVYTYQRLKYAIQHPDKELSALFLSYQNKDSILKYFHLLEPNVLSTWNGQELKKRVQVYNQTRIGELAPNIIEAGKFKLSELKGKIVVLDFWGTWCGACIKDFPKMRDYYAKYNDKVEFVGIACNDSKSAWKKTIREEGLNWTQLFNTPSVTDFAKQYAIDTYPTKIIINEKGEILKIFKGVSGDFYKQLDLLINENQ